MIYDLQFTIENTLTFVLLDHSQLSILNPQLFQFHESLQCFQIVVVSIIQRSVNFRTVRQ